MIRILLAPLAAVLLIAVAPPAAHAADAKNIVVSEAWARATPGATKVGAAYVTIDNRGTAADRLVGANSPVASRVEIHTHEMAGSVMRMRKIAGIDVEPGASLSFQSAGYHLMLFGLTEPLHEGSSFSLALQFKESGWIEVTVDVRGVGTRDTPDRLNRGARHHKRRQ